MMDAGDPIGHAYLDAGNWEVEIAGARYPVIASLRPLYHPKMSRVRS
jgi:hypothetical protein